MQATVGQHLDRLLGGVGTVLIIEGNAGMGKTRLLEEVAEMAERLSIRVGRGTAEHGDTVVQLSPLMEALFDGRSPILDRAALGDGHGSPEQRFWLLHDIQSLLERAALETPLIVCLDDLQWADGGTATALRSLPGRLSGVPVGWVVAQRPSPKGTRLAAALDELQQYGASRISLGALGDHAVAQVTSDLLCAEPGDELLALTARAEGNPFLLVELLSGIREDENVRIDGGRAELVESRLPRRVSESMRGRLGRLSDTARQIAIVGASLGRLFTVADVGTMLDLQPTSLLEPVEELMYAGLLADRQGRLGFPHDLTLEAVRTSVPESVRRALDRQAASVLLTGGALPVEVAMQLAASSEFGDELAIATLLQAAEMLGQTDPGAAADLGQRALDLCPSQHRLRAPLVAGTAVWLHAAGRGAEAKTFADTALRQVLPAQQEATVRLSIAGMFSISAEVRADSARTALALPGLPAHLRARHLAHLFHNLVTAGRTEQARDILPEASQAVQECEDLGGQFILELAEAGLLYSDWQFEGALRLVDQSLRTGAAVNDETRAHLSRLWRGDVLAMLDRVDDALAYETDNLIAAQRNRQGWALHTYEVGRGRLLFQLGRLNDAAVALDDGFSLESAQEVVTCLDAAGVVALGRVAIHRGDQAQVRRATDVARVMMKQGAPTVRRHAAWLLALAVIADGDAARAVEALSTYGAGDRLSILPLFPMDVLDEVRLMRIAVGANDADLADQASDHAAQRAHVNPDVRSIAAVAAHVNGIRNSSLVDLGRAVELFEDGPRPLALAGALEDLGTLAVGSGATEQGSNAFARSLSIFTSCGAEWDAARLRGRLRALGVRRRLYGPSRPRAGWDALTDSELAVARLVAEGFTNREAAERLYVSHYTISGHLRSIFTKLNVNSRVELTRIVTARDGGSPRLER